MKYNPAFLLILSMLCALHSFAQKGDLIKRSLSGHELTYFQRIPDSVYNEDRTQIQIVHFAPIITRLDGELLYFNLLDSITKRPPYIDSGAAKLQRYFMNSLQAVAAKQLANGQYHFQMITVLVDKNGRIAHSEIESGQAMMHDPVSGETNTISEEKTDTVKNEVLRLLTKAYVQPVLTIAGKPVPYELDYEFEFELKDGHLIYPVVRQ